MRSSLRMMVILIVTALALQVGLGVASSFPTRPIELLVPYNPGGGSGRTAEMMRKIVKDENLSPQPIVTSYKPGASGQIGWAYVAGRKGDGHMITSAVSSWIVAQLQGKTPLKPEDFTPIALMALDTQLIVAHVDSFKTLQEVVQASQKAPKSVKVGITGATGADATCATMVEMATGIKLNQIPFKSTGESIAAILGRHVELLVANPNEVFEHMQAGKLRAFGVFAEERLKFMKDVPTMKELGYKNVIYNVWRGILAPAAIPKHEEEWVVNLMKKITESREWVEYCNKNMMSAKFLGGPDFGKFLSGERARLREVFKVMGLLKKKK